MPYKRLKIKMVSDFSTPALEALPMEQCFLRENYFLLRILYPVKLPVRHESKDIFRHATF